MPVINVKALKADLRAKYRKIRECCPADVKKSLDQSLTRIFLNLHEYKQCEKLFVFVSSPIEVDTTDIICQALSDGKQVAVPKCTDKNGKMEFYFIKSLNQLEKGTFGIMEPKENICEQVSDLGNGLCIVPGICFDMFGYRIGFGKGYYDRFLERFGGTTAGLCYSKCTEHELPRGNHDKRVDILITEKFINHTNNLYSKG